MIETLTSLVDSFASALPSASDRPCTSALRMIFSSSDQPSSRPSACRATPDPPWRDHARCDADDGASTSSFGCALIDHRIENFTRTRHPTDPAAQPASRDQPAPASDPVVAHRADFAHLFANHHRVSPTRSVPLNQHRRDRTPLGVHLRFDDSALGRLVRVRARSRTSD